MTRSRDDMNSIKATARRAGALYFLFMIVGLVDMFGFSFIVPGDATATARNIIAAELTYRIGILTDFVTLLLFIFLVVSLYNLLKGADKWYALLMVLLVSVGVTIGLVNILNLNSHGNTIATAFWGLWLFPFGILVIKSGFFPRVLGILLMVAGLALLTISVTSIVLPAYEHVVSRAMMPLSLGEFPIIFWLLIKGAKAPQPQVGSSQVS